MARDRADFSTLDLLTDWKPDTGQVRYAESEVRAATLDARIAKAVAMALKSCGLDRDRVATEMTRFLGGERVSVAMLNAYASQAKENHKITLARFGALVHATKDFRLLSLLPEMFGYAVVEQRFVNWIEVGQLREQMLKADRLVQAALMRAEGRLK